MPQIKIFYYDLQYGDYDDNYESTIVREHDLSDWIEVSDEELVVLKRNKPLIPRPPNFNVGIIVMPDSQEKLCREALNTFFENVRIQEEKAEKRRKKYEAEEAKRDHQKKLKALERARKRAEQLEKELGQKK